MSAFYQTIALEQVLAGASITNAARAAKIHRSTVHRWLREDWSFQATRGSGEEPDEDLASRVDRVVDVIKGDRVEVGFERAEVVRGIVKALSLEHRGVRYLTVVPRSRSRLPAQVGVLPEMQRSSSRQTTPGEREPVQAQP